MAMTIKEREAMTAALREARIAGALRWTEAPARDVPPPTHGEGIENGWDFNAVSPRVEKACTSSVHHSFGNWDRTTTQRPRSLYSTKLRALRALRAAMEKKCAEELAHVDWLIAAERTDSFTEAVREP